MKERIFEFLRAENKSSAQFAEEIKVQPSGISHILSGRNNPSLDFVIKMLERYKYLSSDWLLFGKGSMYKSSGSGSMPGLFDQPGLNEEIHDISPTKTTNESDYSAVQDSLKESITKAVANDSNIIKKIVFFYSDNSFEEFNPRTDRNATS
ncbi:MAG TPA: helix-turn-helix transcriptional regulator [Bacteroidales bacterium]|nr:helix-turn-helix transcriptional regulator [Bacteroidales bacterium]